MHSRYQRAEGFRMSWSNLDLGDSSKICIILSLFSERFGPKLGSRGLRLGRNWVQQLDLEEEMGACQAGAPEEPCSKS